MPNLTSYQLKKRLNTALSAIIMVSEILGDSPQGDSFASRYEVQQLLGKKSGRRSLLAKDQVTGELVVVKLLSFNSDFEWDDLKLFEREAETLKSLSHPAIPRYLDYFEVNSPTIKGFALVQSYIPAQTLEKYLQAGRTFTEAEVKQVATAVLEILIYLHGLHPAVIHRDLKPSNILLGERSGNSVGQVYLVDFGSVQTVLAAEGGTRTVVGTYGYMPPEQFGGRTVRASDLYSLGATLIYLITGKHPADLPQKDFRIQFEQLTHLSPGLTRWLQWMTEPSLERRFSSAVEALNALNESDLSSPYALNIVKPAGSKIQLTKNWGHRLTRWLQSMTEPSLERRFSSAVEALKALNESDLSSPYALNIVKPAGSKIQLTKNWDYLEILIPPVGFKPSMLSTGFFVIVWNSFILLFIIALLFVSFPENIIPLVILLVFLWAGLFMLWNLLFDLFGNIRLSLDDQEISLAYELFPFQFHRPQPAPRSHITKLVYLPRHFTKDSQGDIIPVPAQLEIWAGVQKYQLNVNSGSIQSEAELEWLAHELSNWLSLEITQ
ncbi:serine/threonine kinase [Nodularia spumigena CCY9414]|nr:serine/threonine kinase [Nodularia spumigena CCY9414]